MAATVDPSFAKVLKDCDVPQAFQTWLLNNTIVNRHRFLIVTRRNAQMVDAELIDVCGFQVLFPKKIAVRLAWAICETSVCKEQEANLVA